MGITVANISKNFGDFAALHDVSLEVKSGALTALLGPSGSGKTTVARLMGEMLHEIGLLRRGHLVEARSSDLVADHVGGTAIKTNKELLR